MQTSSPLRERDRPQPRSRQASRKASGLSQKQLAKSSGVQRADISKIERGFVNPTIGTIEKLAQPLGAQVRVLPRDLPAAA